jgi:hypothetical protein
MNNAIRTVTMVVVTLAGAASGCGKATKSKQALPTPSASSSAAVALAPRVDAALLSLLAGMAKTCKVEVKEGAVHCAQGEQRQLVGEFVSNQRRRNGAVATFAAALADKEVPLRAVAASVLQSAFRSPWGTDPSSLTVDATDAEKLLTTTLALPEALARRAVPAAVHASMLAGRSEALYAALDKSPDSEVRLIATRYLLTHGRLAGLPRIQALAKEPSSAVVLAALESPRNMYSWSAAEQAAICPWAASFVSDQRPAVAAKAASVLSSCNGEWVDRLIDYGEKAVAEKTLGAMQLGAYRDLCAPHHTGRETGPTAAQCKRSRALLEKAVNSTALDEQVRSAALTSLAYQWPDNGALKLARQLSKAKEKTLAEVARRTVERLERRGAASTKPDAAAKEKTAGPVRPAAVAAPNAPAAVEAPDP